MTQVDPVLVSPVPAAGLPALFTRWLDTVLRANLPFRAKTWDVAINPPNLAGGATVEVTVTVAGLTTDATVIVNKPTETSGLTIGNARVSATDTLVVQFANVTAAPINAGSETYRVTAFRP